MELRVGIVVSNSARSADRRSTIPADIPCESKTRRKDPPIIVPPLLTRESWISRKIEAQRRLRECRTLDAGDAVFFTKGRDLTRSEPFREVGLPTQAVTGGQPRIDFPHIGDVSREVPLAHVIDIRCRLGEAPKPTQQEVRHCQSVRGRSPA